MHFVLMFKMDALRMSRQRLPLNVTLRLLLDVFETCLQNPKTIKPITFKWFRQTFGEIKLKIMQFKCIYTRGSKLLSLGRYPKFVFSGLFDDVRRTWGREKLVLKIKLTITEYRRDSIIGIFIWTTYDQTESSGIM